MSEIVNLLSYANHGLDKYVSNVANEASPPLMSKMKSPNPRIRQQSIAKSIQQSTAKRIQVNQLVKFNKNSLNNNRFKHTVQLTSLIYLSPVLLIYLE